MISYVRVQRCQPSRLAKRHVWGELCLGRENDKCGPRVPYFATNFHRFEMKAESLCRNEGRFCRSRTNDAERSTYQRKTSAKQMCN